MRSDSERYVSHLHNSEVQTALINFKTKRNGGHTNFKAKYLLICITFEKSKLEPVRPLFASVMTKKE